MLGKASEIEMTVCGSIDDYREWQARNADAIVLDIKYSMLKQNQQFQYSYGILIIYKEAE